MAPSPKRRPGRSLVLGAGIASLVFAAPAGANVISPETPHSPNAEEAQTLYWIGLIAILAIILAVNGALIFAARRFRSERGAEPRQLASGRGVQVRVGAGLAGVALVLFAVSIFFTERARDVPPSGPEGLQASGTLLAQRSLDIPEGDDEPLRITATGQQWIWRYDYPNGAASYYELVVPVDTTIVLSLLSTDVTHSWFVPELGGKFQAVPGKRNLTFFRADEEGTYTGRSATFSGAAYPAMRTQVTVVSPAEYERFLDQQAEEILEGENAVDPSEGSP